MNFSSPTLPPSPDEMLEQTRLGQRWILFAILLNVAAFVLGILPAVRALAAVGGVLGILGFLGGIAALILSILGWIKLGGGLGFGMTVRVVFLLLMFIPLVNLILMLVVNGMATKKLREAGYRVGLLGAAPKSA